jgi:hypothetical protein
VVEQPAFPTKRLLGVIAATANIIALVLWFRMHQPLAWKLVVGGGEAMVAALIIGIHLGEQRMYVRANSTMRSLQEQLAVYEEVETPPTISRRRRAA